MDTRVFWSVLCALLVFFGLVVAGLSVMYQAQQRAAVEAQEQAQQRVVAVAQQAQRDFEASRQRQATYERLQLDCRRLLSNQRCVGGAVVQVQGNTFVQLGTLA